MPKFYQCNGCLSYYPPEELRPCEVYSIIVGETYWVILCADCIERYAEWDMINSDTVEVEGEHETIKRD